MAFPLSPHCSKLLQPLDMGVFDGYQHHQNEAIRVATATGSAIFPKDDFRAALASICQETLA